MKCPKCKSNRTMQETLEKDAILTNRMTRNFIAKKQYVCSTCGTCIVIGERYYYQTTRGQGKKNYKYHYCLKCRSQNAQLHKEGYSTRKSKDKLIKCVELVKKYGAIDAKELRKLVEHTGSMISLARMVSKHFPEIKYERFRGQGQGHKRSNTNGEKMRVKGTVIILFVDRNEMYRILKQRFNIMKISQILPRSAKWRHYNLLCMVEPNVLDKGVVAYVGKVYDYHNELVYQINGSVRYPWQRVVGLDVLADMVEWCFKNVHHGSIINIYTSDLDGVVRRDVHDFVSPSIILRDTLVMKLKWFAKSSVHSLQGTEYHDKVKCMVLDEAHLSVDEALHINRPRINTKRLPMPKDVPWGERICGHIRGQVYISKRTKRHYCYKFQGWGIQTCIVERLEKENIFDIEIVYEDEQEIRLYHTTVQKFRANAIKACLSEVDGEQMFLPEEYWYVQRIPIGQIDL